MGSRPDLSPYLVHWTKGESHEHAFQRLLAIACEGVLKGSNSEGKIRGGSLCVCFTEARPEIFHMTRGRYSPFGFKFSKKYIYALGGRPVIYQGRSEFMLLHEEIQWRHVTYDPCSEGFWTDFTWEREWRLRADLLQLDPLHVSLLVPDSKTREEVEDAYSAIWQLDQLQREQAGLMIEGDDSIPFAVELFDADSG